MFAWLTFGSMAFLIFAPLAVAFRNRAAVLFKEQPAILAFWAAFLAFAAVIAGLLARSQSAANAFHAIEIAAMLCAGAAIGIGLLSIVGLQSTSVRIAAVVAILAGDIVLRLAGMNGQGAAAIAWMSATGLGLALAFAKAPLGGRQLLRRPSVMLALAFVPIHAAQIVQIVASGQLKALVPGVSVAAMAAIAAFVTDRAFRKPMPAYARSGMDRSSAERLFSAIELLMAEDKPYLRYELRRENLARALGVTPRAIGEAINRCTELSFAAYLRRLRTVEAERLFVDPRNEGVSLEALGMQAGFKSRSAFYTAFLEISGVSPGERRARLAPIRSGRSG